MSSSARASSFRARSRLRGADGDNYGFVPIEYLSNSRVPPIEPRRTRALNLKSPPAHPASRHTDSSPSARATAISHRAGHESRPDKARPSARRPLAHHREIRSARTGAPCVSSRGRYSAAVWGTALYSVFRQPTSALSGCCAADPIAQLDIVLVARPAAVGRVRARRKKRTEDTVLHVKHRHMLVDYNLEPRRGRPIEQIKKLARHSGRMRPSPGAPRGS